MGAGASPGRDREPLVLALDAGSSSLRCGAFDHRARPLDGMAAKVSYRLETDRRGRSTADPDALLKALVRCVDAVLDKLGDDAQRIAAVGCCTFVANVVGLDWHGKPLTPLSTYADTSSAAYAARLAGELDAEAVRQRTGCTLHPSYLPARLALWREENPDIFGAVRRWATLGEYFEQALFGPESDACGISCSAAAWSGLLNRHTIDWDEELLDHLGVSRDRLPRVTDINEPRKGFNAAFAARWPALKDVPWLPAVGDGAAANVGSVVDYEDGRGNDSCHTVVVTLGTTAAVRMITRSPIKRVPDGLWCYRVDRERLLPGGALSEGGNVHAWLRDTLRLDLNPDEQETALAAMSPDSHGLTFLPLFAGERSPGWRGDATATIHDITLATTPLDMLRAGMEAVALRLAMVFDLLKPLAACEDETAATTGTPIRVVAGGGSLIASPAWAQMVADAFGQDMHLSAQDETSLRGAAVLALEHLGIAPGAQPHAEPDGNPGTIFHANPDAHAAYNAARARQARLYDALGTHENA